MGLDREKLRFLRNSTLTYHIGCNADSEVLLRVKSNSGNGYFSQEWVPPEIHPANPQRLRQAFHLVRAVSALRGQVRQHRLFPHGSPEKRGTGETGETPL